MLMALTDCPCMPLLQERRWCTPFADDRGSENMNISGCSAKLMLRGMTANKYDILQWDILCKALNKHIFQGYDKRLLALPLRISCGHFWVVRCDMSLRSTICHLCLPECSWDWIHTRKASKGQPVYLFAHTMSVGLIAGFVKIFNFRAQVSRRRANSWEEDSRRFVTNWSSISHFKNRNVTLAWFI